MIASEHIRGEGDDEDHAQCEGETTRNDRKDEHEFVALFGGGRSDDLAGGLALAIGVVLVIAFTTKLI